MHTLDEDELDNMEDEEEREEGVAVDIKGIRPLDTLLDCVHHVLFEILVCDVPSCTIEKVAERKRWREIGKE